MPAVMKTDRGSASEVQETESTEAILLKDFIKTEKITQDIIRIAAIVLFTFHFQDVYPAMMMTRRIHAKEKMACSQ